MINEHTTFKSECRTSEKQVAPATIEPARMNFEWDAAVTEPVCIGTPVRMAADYLQPVDIGSRGPLRGLH